MSRLALPKPVSRRGPLADGWRNSLRRRLLYSHLAIAFEGVLLPILTLMIVRWMRSSAWSDAVLTASVGLTLVIGSAASAALYCSAERLTRPLAALSAAIEQLAAGELQSDLCVTTADEVGHLTSSLNTLRTAIRHGQTIMQQAHRQLTELYEKLQIEALERSRVEQALRDAEQKLVELNNSLEERVAERTRELQQRIEELEERNAELDQSTDACHDVQECLRKLLAFSQLLEQDIDVELNESAKIDLYHIIDASRRMQRLVLEGRAN